MRRFLQGLLAVLVVLMLLGVVSVTTRGGSVFQLVILPAFFICLVLANLRGWLEPPRRRG